MQIRVLCCLVFLSVLANPHFLLAQKQQPASDPQAVALAQQSIAALTNGNPVFDAALNGTATWIAGSDNETGTVTLQAKGTVSSRVDLTLRSGTSTEIRNDSSPTFPQGETITSDGTKQWAQHNCWINAAWFFPALSVLAAADPSVILAYVGPEKRGDASVQHIRAFRYLPNKSAAFTAAAQALSAQDIYLDSASLLPVAFTFNTHPDDDDGTNILVEIDFSNYQPISGVEVPMRLQKLINGGLALDISLTDANLNSGLADAQFAIQ